MSYLLTPITDAYQWNANDHFEQTFHTTCYLWSVLCTSKGKQRTICRGR